ncbi:hypothetical protein F3Y22_tig00112249pilonHSYRG00348 [Hibiscus syriacus]|uniref:C-JID domain-containing protein n=1 Tax=Hibiscus syriacus TaxID=106335 RepID=A0A6A2XR23_HIBSY|nr:hypothetical protein F3Y22_tig00112249pilonHSYRG00348 [Hibiscus syriacus]
MTRFDSLLSRRHGFENILNLRYIDLDTECLLFQNENVIAHNGDSVSFPDELRYLCWSGYPFKSLPPNYNPKNLAILKLHFGCMEQLWNEDHQDLVNLRIIDLFYCIKLRKIPNLSRAINLKSLCCHLVEPLELPNNITELNLSHTVIKETLPELPRYLWFLDARNCTSLEKVSFTDDSFNPFHSLHDGDGAPRREIISMLFSNCRSLNQDSIKNIVANTMLQIHSLAQRWVRRKGISLGEYRWDFLFCCFPGNEVPEIVFYYRSMDYSFDLKITPNGFSGSRLLAFAVCLVADLTLTKRNLEFICKYRLTTTSGEKFASKCCVSVTLAKICNCKGDHVFILFNQDMIIIDNDYEEASFELYIRNLAGDEFKVEKCGVNIFYMDAEGYTISDVMRWDKSNQNSDSQEVANIEVAHDGSATEIRPGDERRFGNGGEEGDGGPKTLK